MSTGLSGVTGSIVEYALDGLSLRHAAIAANIANANSPGFRPFRVSFETQLADALARGDAAAPGTASSLLAAPQVTTDAPVAEPLRRGALESEVVQLSRNVLQYQALVRGLDKYNSMIGTAINEGKR